MVVFDIDDTIVDIRLPLLYVLRKYDSVHDTTYFADLDISDIKFEEWHIQNWLPSRILDQEVINQIVSFVRENMWNEKTIFLSHRPFRGVLEIIRWFQIQENTYVGLNTGRSEELRETTLKSLNILGREYRVKFDNEFLYMNPLPNSDDKDVTSYKSQGIKYYQDKGFKVIAFIDNEPANLNAVDEAFDEPELLLLHADTIFGSSRALRPQNSVVGDEYQITEVIDPDLIPDHVEFIWNGVNSYDVLEDYQQSNVFWAELDVRSHPLTGELVLRHSRFDAPEFHDEGLVAADSMIEKLLPLERGIKLVLKEDDGLLDRLIEMINKYSIDSSLIWFDIIFEVFNDDGLKKIQDAFPNAIISTRVDFMVPLLSQFPTYVKEILENLSNKGISQYSVSIDTYNKEVFFSKLEEWGFDINLRDIYSLEEFLRGILMLPKSIISNFNFQY